MISISVSKSRLPLWGFSTATVLFQEECSGAQGLESGVAVNLATLSYHLLVYAVVIFTSQQGVETGGKAST